LKVLGQGTVPANYHLAITHLYGLKHF